MRIRTTKDVDKLNDTIKDKLGIEIQKYRNEEIAENFVELLVFPAYVVNWVIRPVLIALGVFIIGFFILDLVHIQYFIYAIVGLILFLINGILTGLLFLIWKMKSDMWGIVDYSLEIMKSAVLDMSKANNQITKENRKEVLGLLFKGIIHIVTIPMISKAISNKVPLIGDFVNAIVKKILTLVADKVRFDEKSLKEELSKKEGESNAFQVYTKVISKASSGLEKVMNVTFGVAQLPLKIAFGITFLLLALFIYLIN